MADVSIMTSSFYNLNKITSAVRCTIVLIQSLSLSQKGAAAILHDTSSFRSIGQVSNGGQWNSRTSHSQAITSHYQTHYSRSANSTALSGMLENYIVCLFVTLNLRRSLSLLQHLLICGRRSQSYRTSCGICYQVCVSDDMMSVILYSAPPVPLHRGVSTDEVTSEEQSSEEMVCNDKTAIMMSLLCCFV